MKLIIAGSRGITDINIIFDAVGKAMIHEWDIKGLPDEVVSGTARGVDRLGEAWANNYGVKVTRMPAQWNIYGKSAGYRRNEEMAIYANALVAIWDGESRGTKHMIDLANKHGLKVYVYNTGEDND